MTANRGDELAEAYLARLDQAARELPAQGRAELVAQVREHIASARTHAADQGGSDEIAVRNTLDDLGPPEQIVAAASGDPAGAAGPRPGGRSAGQQVYDLVTVLLLLLGGVVVPVLGWLVGVALLWASRRWSLRDKVLGTLVVPLGLAVPVWLALSADIQSCVGGEAVDGRTVREVCEPLPRPAWVTVMSLVVLTVAPLVMAGVLLRRAGRASHPAPTSPHPDAVADPSNTP
jgi:hypothetical protein